MTSHPEPVELVPPWAKPLSDWMRKKHLGNPEQADAAVVAWWYGPIACEPAGVLI